MKETRVASRYSKALFDLAIEMNLLEQVKQDIELIYDVCKENREFLLMLKSPVIKDSKKRAVIKEIFEKHLNAITIKFLMVITKNGREQIIMEIAEQFIVIYKEFKNILPTTLISAVKLDRETIDKIIQLLADNTKAEIELTEKINEEIIGGFIMEVEDKQYDASVLRKIKNLRKEFDINLYVKGF